ncbi:MAG TPA: ATP-binding cassette domain-containing protein, partial [Terriglobia bacterium]|nr:ATP-binding cassette domain-containing protein [Terriglobia bacterium]
MENAATETGTHPGPTPAAAKISVRQLNFYYGARQVLMDVSLNVADKKITALIGPSGCGKSTFLRTLNRMYETVRQARAEGEITLDGEDIFALDVALLRRRVGMVFQKSNPFPKTIFENVAYGLRVNGWDRSRTVNDLVEQSLRRAALWDEVKDSLHKSAYALSGGQQQRLC